MAETLNFDAVQDFGGLEQTLEQLAGSMKTVADSGKQMTATLAAAGQGLAQLSAPIVQSVSSALQELSGCVNDAAADVENLLGLLAGDLTDNTDETASAVKSVGTAAAKTAVSVSKATRTLAAFDEINRLAAGSESTSGGKSGSSSGGSSKKSSSGKAGDSLLDTLLEGLKGSDWYLLGETLAEKLNEAMENIPWQKIQKKAQKWADELADLFNGFAEKLNWTLVGTTLGSGLNTALIFLDSCIKNFHWVTLGQGIAEALNGMVQTVDWATLGEVLFGGLNIAFQTLYGFATTLDFAAIGLAAAAALTAAFASIDWAQAGQGVSAFVTGLLTAILTFLQETDWTAIGQDIAVFLENIDWQAILSGVVQVMMAALQALFELSAPLQGISIFAALFGALNAAMEALPVLGAPLLVFFAALNPVVTVVTASIAALVAIGISLGAGWEALTQGAKSLASGAGTAWNTLSANVTERVQSMKNAASQLVSHLVGNVQTRWQSVCSALGGSWQSFSSTVTENLSGLGSSFSSVWSGIVSTVKSAVSTVISVVNGMVSTIANAVSGIRSRLSGVDGMDSADSVSNRSVSVYSFATSVPAMAAGQVLPSNRSFLTAYSGGASESGLTLDTVTQAFRDVLSSADGSEERAVNIYLGDEKLDSILLRSQSRRLLRSGGRG